MARSFLTPIDLNKLELLQPRLQQLASDPGSPVTGQFYYNTTSGTLRVWSGSAWVELGRLDQVSVPTAAVAMNAQRLTDLADPSAAQDAATKHYVDGLQAGLAWKAAVRVATTVAGTLASGFEAGDTVDGVVLAAGDRLLIKDQASAAENGIYVVQASGAPTRASDADTGAELRQAALFVMEGSTNADTAWVCTTDGTITLGSTALAFAQFGASTSYVEGTGIDIAGNVIALETPVAVPNGGTGAATLTDHGVLLGSGTGAVTPTAVGSTGTVLKGNTGADPSFGAVSLTADVTGTLPVSRGGLGVASPTDHAVLVGSGTGAVTPIAVGASGTVLRGATGADPAFGQVDLTSDVTGDLPVAEGGTGASTAAGAKTNLGFMSRYAANVGDGSNTAYTVTHDLGTLDVVCRLFRNADGVEVEADITHATADTLTVTFAVAPTSNQYRAVVVG